MSVEGLWCCLLIDLSGCFWPIVAIRSEADMSRRLLSSTAPQRSVGSDELLTDVDFYGPLRNMANGRKRVQTTILKICFGNNLLPTIFHGPVYFASIFLSPDTASRSPMAVRLEWQS